MMDFSITERFTPLRAMIPPKLMVRSFISKRDIWIRIRKTEAGRQKNGLKTPFWGCGYSEF